MVTTFDDLHFVATVADLIRHHGVRVPGCKRHHVADFHSFIRFGDGPAACFRCHDGKTVHIMRMGFRLNDYHFILRTEANRVESNTRKDGIFWVWEGPDPRAA